MTLPLALHVTQADIDLSRRLYYSPDYDSLTHCPVALAMTRQLKRPVTVGVTVATVDKQMVYLHRNVSFWIMDYMIHNEAQPQIFTNWTF